METVRQLELRIEQLRGSDRTHAQREESNYDDEAHQGSFCGSLLNSRKKAEGVLSSRIAFLQRESSQKASWGTYSAYRAVPSAAPRRRLSGLKMEGGFL